MRGNHEATINQTLSDGRLADKRTNDGYTALVGCGLQAADDVAIHCFCQFGVVSAKTSGKHLGQYRYVGFSSQGCDTFFCQAEIGFFVCPCDGVL
jgi:hypothetical protein